MATSVLLLAFGILYVLWRPSDPWVATFVVATGIAWSLHFGLGLLDDRLGPDREAAGRVLFSIFLTLASLALAVSSLLKTGRRHAGVAAGVGSVLVVALFIGRGVPEFDAATVARLARDTGLGAFVFALVLYALQVDATAGRRAAWGSLALLLYPGIVAGIYLHPTSHRNMLGLALALLFVAVLWLRNTANESKAASRRALLVSLCCFALPLLAMAAVRWQGGMDAAAHGPLRAVARTAGPILYALAVSSGWRGEGSS